MLTLLIRMEVVMNKISKVAQFIRFYLWIYIVISLVFHFLSRAYYLHFPWFDIQLDRNLAEISVDFFRLPLWQRLLVAFVAFPKTLLKALAAWNLAKLMTCYKKEEYFTEKTSRCLQYVGIFALSSEVGEILLQIPETYCLTFRNPVGQRLISISLSDEQITSIILSSVIILIGWVMKKAAIFQKKAAETI